MSEPKAKPTPKRQVAVSWVGQATRYLHFYSTTDALPDLTQFGGIVPTGEPNEYSMTVDSRYDFDEVLNYLENYG